MAWRTGTIESEKLVSSHAPSPATRHSDPLEALGVGAGRAPLATQLQASESRLLRRLYFGR